MSQSQYSKRKKKAEQSVEDTVSVEIEAAVIEAIADGDTFIGYDTYYDKVARKHKAVVLSYNPSTLEAKVEEVRAITRSVALVHENNKMALKQLTKRIK